MFIKVGRLIVTHPRLVLFGIIILSVFTVASLSSPVFADTAAKSTSFEKTTLIEYVNNEGVPIKTVRMWLGQDAGTFKSFKTEKGWTGVLSAQGLLVFTSEEPLPPGDSVKFGIKTEVQNPGINWRTLDLSGNELTTGRTVAGQQPPPQDNTQTPPQDNTQKPATSFADAEFKIIPASPKNGDSIRVIGNGFPPNTVVDFYIDSEKLEDFQTDNSGNLIGRAKIPVNKEADRVEFVLSDQQGNKKTLSIRLDHRDAQMTAKPAARLTITQISEIVGPGETARVSGTAKPGSTITISYKDATGIKIQEAVIEVDAQGNWSHERVIPLDAPLGTRVVEFSDGADTITKILSVSVTKSIHVTPSAIRYEPGQTMRFNGTAAADQSVEIVIKDPIGKEIFYDLLKMNGTGTIDFEFPTEQTSLKGTYIIIISQGDDTEILYVGLGVAPTKQVIAKFDKLNYSTSENAKMLLTGPAKANISILILDPSDKVVPESVDVITLGADGNAEYSISLSGYKSGVFTVVLTYLHSETNAVFAVGLQQGSGKIIMQTTKQTYQLGDSILVLGSTNKNVLLILEMSDPQGNVVKRKETFSDKEGKFSDGTFRIPSDAEQGIWTIKASSGPNLADVKLNVVGTVTQAFVVSVDKSTAYSVGDTMTITGSGGGKTQTVIIKIFNSNDVEITELIVFSTENGSFQTLWLVPSDMVPGTYKIQAKIANEIAETTFSVQ
ncbi:biofilm-associated protein [Candidatus Parcubacteria bacterium]|nr:MAG: biofilm-associated protein [Candidatus Parcubacteria bacterium]